MGGQNSWRIPDDSMSDYMRQQEKRLLHEERRPLIRSAAALLGPGFAPFAVPLVDWNADETLFNGHFYSDAGAQNSPDILRAWIGTVLRPTPATASRTCGSSKTVWLPQRTTSGRSRRRLVHFERSPPGRWSRSTLRRRRKDG